MKRVFVTGSILAVLVSIVGCAAGNPLVGKWTGEVANQGQAVPATIEYKPDGTFTVNVVGQGMDMSMSGTYTFKDGTLSSTTTDAKINKLPPQAEAMRPMIEEQMKKSLNQASSSKVNVKSADELEMESEGRKFTLKKVKS